MPVATEVGQFNLLSSVDLTQPDSPAIQHLQKVFQIVKQAKGYVRAYWGVKVGNPSSLIVLVDWEDVKYHQDLVNSEAFRTMSGEIANVVDFEAGPPLVVHAHFTPDAISARQAAITSLHSFKLPATASEQQKSALEDSFLRLAKFCATQTSCTGYACGWVLEPLPDADAPSDQVITLTGVFGWRSKGDFRKVKDDLSFVEATTQISAITLPQKEEDSFLVKLHQVE